MAGENEFRLEEIFGSPAVQQSASDATDYMAGINPRKAETAQNQAAEFKVNLNTGTMDMSNVPITKVGEYLGARQQQDDIQRIYAQSLAELQRERAAQAAHPFANTLAQIGAAIAAGDRDPRVRSLGQLAQNLNPTPQTLRERELDVLRGAGSYGIARERNLMEEQQIRLAQQRETRMAEMARLTQAAKSFHELSASAQKGELTDVGLTSQVLQDVGYPKKQADAQAALLVGASQTKQAAVEALATAKSEKERLDRIERARESDNRIAAILKGINVKAGEKAEGDNALRAVAKSLAAGDLQAIRDVTSFRGQDRAKIFQYTKEIDPNFSTAELTRKIKMEELVTTGKEGEAIRMFDTFLQHGGELADTLKGISLSNTPAYNRPMNWWRRHMSGSPEFQRFLTAIEPVGKEFFGFLLGGKALYADDRERMKMLVESDLTPRQIMAALGQMGKTAKDRYTAINQRYKRVMKHDIEDPFSPEAIIGAEKIGLRLGAPSGAGSPPSDAEFNKMINTGRPVTDPATGITWQRKDGAVVQVP